MSLNISELQNQIKSIPMGLLQEFEEEVICE